MKKSGQRRRRGEGRRGSGELVSQVTAFLPHQSLNQSTPCRILARNSAVVLGSGGVFGGLGVLGRSAGHDQNASKAKRRTRAGSEIGLGKPPARAQNHLGRSTACLVEAITYSRLDRWAQSSAAAPFLSRQPVSNHMAQHWAWYSTTC